MQEPHDLPCLREMIRRGIFCPHMKAIAVAVLIPAFIIAIYAVFNVALVIEKTPVTITQGLALNALLAVPFLFAYLVCRRILR